MAALTLTLKGRPPERLDLSDVLPDRLAGLKLAEIRALPIGTTKTGVTIGEVFDAAASPAIPSCSTAGPTASTTSAAACRPAASRCGATSAPIADAA